MAKRENLAKKKKQLAKSVSTATDSMKTRMFESKIRKKPYEATEGKMYPEDKLKKLISKLISGQRKMEQEAAIEFMEYQEEIALAISNTPDLSQTDVMDKVIENIQKDQHAFFMKLEREGRSKQLKFLIKSGAVPKNMQERAEESLVRVDPKMAAQLKGEKAKKKIKRQKLIGATPVPKEVLRTVLRDIKSAVAGKGVEAAIKFLSDYQRFATAINMTPNLSVTRVNKKVAAVLEKHGGEVIRRLVASKNVKALKFLASFSAAPAPIKDSAKVKLQKIEQEAEPKKEAPKAKVVATPVKMKAKPREYTAQQVEKLFERMGNKEKLIAVAAVIEFITSYSKISEALMKAPMLSVTDMTKRALKVIKANSKQMFRILESTKNIKALKYLSTSSNIPGAISKKAKVVLKRLAPPPPVEKEVEEEKEEKEEEKPKTDRAVTEKIPEGDGGEEEEEESEEGGEGGDDEGDERRGEWSKFK